MLHPDVARLVIGLTKEASDLDSKLERVTKFILSPRFSDLSDDHQKLLKQQEIHMTNYSSVLADRLSLLINQ